MASSLYLWFLCLQFVGMAQAYKICTIYDDPMMKTFDANDGSYVMYHGTCELIYTHPCTSNSPGFGIPYFKAYGQNNKIYSQPSGGRYDPSFPTIAGVIVTGLQTSQVFLENVGSYYTPQVLPKVNFWGNVITIGNLPYFDGNGVSVDIDPLDPSRLNIDTLFGLTVSMNHNNYVTVELSQSLALVLNGQLCGACGRYNGIQSDDFSHHDGTQFSVQYDGSGYPYVSQDFYEPYITQPDNPAGCTRDPRFNVDGSRKKRQVDECSGRQYAKARKLCRLINDRKGPFASCYNQTAGRESRYQACISVMCLDEAFGCASLEGYAGYCGQFGELGAWRSEGNCPLKCGEGQVYSVVASRDCIPTCYDPNPCPDFKPNMKGKKAIKGGIFQEGCVCEPGLVWNGSGCVSQDNCPSMLREHPEQKCRGLFGKKRGECMAM